MRTHQSSPNHLHLWAEILSKKTNYLSNRLPVFIHHRVPERMKILHPVPIPELEGVPSFISLGVVGIYQIHTVQRLMNVPHVVYYQSEGHRLSGVFISTYLLPDCLVNWAIFISYHEMR